MDSPKCIRCNCEIQTVEQTYCDSCCEILEADYMDSLAQDAYEYPSESTIINSYCKGRNDAYLY